MENSLCKATALGYKVVQVDSLLYKAHSQGHSSDKSDNYSSAILGEGGVVQVGDNNASKSAHVEEQHVVQVGHLFMQDNSQVQGESLRKVTVHRGIKRKRS